MKKIDYVKQGKRNRANGSAFELRVRNDLNLLNWVVDKWSNQVDLEKDELIKAKSKWAGFGRPMMIGQGFPDFIAFKKVNELFEVIGVESKINGYLSKIEKEKCKWLLKNKIFNKIFIASKIKIKNRVHVNYKLFKI